MYDVAIVGCGATGVSLANLLGLRGLSVVVVDREAGILELPRAVHFDGEVMRIFETMGLAEPIAACARASSGMRYLTPQGDVLIERRPASAVGRHGWADNYLFHQPHLEQVLRNGLRRFANVDVRLSCEVSRVTQDADRTTLATSAGEIEARWVVGCDGARSLVRQAIGATHEDLGLHQPWLVVDVVLSRDVDLPPYSIQHCDPARPATYVNVTGARRRWEIMLMPGDDPARMTEPATVWRLLAPWLRPEQAQLERAAVYTFHSLIADRWRDRRLLLAGDAAHQTPPFLGQGMCAGIRDAANLAWKLPHEALLDSYQTERMPHVRVFIEEALRMGGIIQTTDPAVAAERDRRYRASGREEMVNLVPRLGPGLHADEGTIFPQPVLADGRRLDAAIGGMRFAVLGPERPALPEGVAFVPFDGPGYVVLRPDRYVFGRAADQLALQALVAGLPRV